MGIQEFFLIHITKGDFSYLNCSEDFEVWQTFLS